MRRLRLVPQRRGQRRGAAPLAPRPGGVSRNTYESSSGCCGLHVHPAGRYETVEANTVTHRASAPYKAFREAVAEQCLLERTSDLRFWRPTGIGFLTPPGRVQSMKNPADSDCRYVIVNELIPKTGMKAIALGKLREGAVLAADTATTARFWVLDRGDDDEDQSLYVFSMFERKADAEAFEAGEVRANWKVLDEICESRRRTSWVECGIGFLGRP